jgi:hypothetical protein
MCCPDAVRTFLTSSRARGARRARLSAGVSPAPRDRGADSNAAQLPPGSLWALTPGKPSHAGRLVPLLGPPGHGGVGALQTPAADRATRDESAQARALQRLPSSRRSSLEPCKITVKSAPPARPADGASATPDSDLPRLDRRLSEGWPGLNEPEPERGLGRAAAECQVERVALRVKSVPSVYNETIVPGSQQPRCPCSAQVRPCLEHLR